MQTEKLNSIPKQSIESTMKKKNEIQFRLNWAEVTVNLIFLHIPRL